MNSQIKSGDAPNNPFSESGQLPVRIVVFGVGGGGGNAVNTMLQNDTTGVEFVVANTDIQALDGNNAQRKIQLGKELTRGFGAGTDPEVGRKAAEESSEEIAKVMKGADLVFITLGMGGGTGTGASPVIARLAREVGALTVAVVTRPFSFEGNLRTDIAQEGIRNLKSCVDSIVSISNDRLLEIAPADTDIKSTYALGDQVLCDSVLGIFEVITKRGYINCDFADLRTVLNNKGTALLGRGTASGPNCVVEAAHKALSSPLLDEIKVREATHLLFNITSPSNLSVKDFSVGTQVIKEEFDYSRTKIVFGHVIDDSLAESGSVHVTAIATGFSTPEDENFVEETLEFSPRSMVNYGAAANASPMRHTQNRRVTQGAQRSTGQYASASESSSILIRDTHEAEPGFMREATARELAYAREREEESLRRSYPARNAALRSSYPAVSATTEELPQSHTMEQARPATATTGRFLRNSEAALDAAKAPKKQEDNSRESKTTAKELNEEEYEMPEFFTRDRGNRGERRGRRFRQDNDN